MIFLMGMIMQRTFVNKIMSVLLPILIGFLGITFPLIFMYSMPNSKPSPLSGAIFLFAISLIVLSLLYRNTKYTYKIQIYSNILLSYILVVSAFTYALISLYSLDEISFPIASAIYFLDSFLMISGLIIFKGSGYENE